MLAATLFSRCARRLARLALVFVGLLAFIGWTAAPASAQDAASAAAPTTTAQHPLWRITDADNTVYLMGSVHLLRPEVYPLAAPMQDAFAQSDRVVFELNLDSLQQGAMTMQQRGMYQDERTIRDALSDSTYARLSARLDTLGLPMQAVQKMKPWMLATSLPGLVLQRGGYDTASGIDMHFYQKAKEAGKPVAGLETFEEQIGFLEQVGADNPDRYMHMTLEQLDGIGAMMDSITVAWERGDVAAIADRLNASMEDFPEMRETLLITRNKNWVPQIVDMIEGSTNTLVVVGTGHLVGSESVVALLLQRGYTVEQL
jgi:hypothetical protein